MARLWKNKKLRIFCIVFVIACSVSVGAFTKNILTDKVLNEELVSDLSTMSGLKNETIYKLYEAVGEWDAVRDNIFIYKYILDEHIKLEKSNKEVYEIIKKYKLDDLIAIYEYSSQKALKQKDIKFMLQQIDNGSDLDTMFAEIVDQKVYKQYNPASKDQIRNWLAEGYSPDDVINADAIARGMDILLQDVFTLKTQDNTWSDVGTILDYVYEEPKTTKVEVKVRHGQELQVLTDENFENIAIEANKKARIEESKERFELKNESFDIDKYMAMGFNVKEINNAVKLSSESGSPVDEILEYKSNGQNWQSVIEKYSKAEGEIIK